jgi:hypothetical protein
MLIQIIIVSRALDGLCINRARAVCWRGVPATTDTVTVLAEPSLPPGDSKL